MDDNIDKIISQEAFDQIERLITELTTANKRMLEVSASALQASKNVATIKLPSDLAKNTADVAALNDQLKKQDAIIKTLEDKIIKLSEARKKHSATTLQERVDARLLLQAETQEAKALSTLTGAYGKLDIAHKKALKSAQDIGAEMGRNSKAFKQAAAEANKLDKELKDIDADLGKRQRNVGNYTKGFNVLSGALGAFGISTGIAGVAMLTKDIYDQVKSMEQLDLALETVTGSQKEFSESQAFLLRLSTSYGSNLKKLTESYIQFYASAKDKISGRQIENIFESISKSAGMLGLSTEKQEKAFLALNQMMSKGTIQAEELRGQLSEALPNAMGIMTKAVQKLNPNMKVTEATIAKMMKNGELMSAEVLPEFARQMEIAYGVESVTKVDTLAASMERMSTKWSEFLRIVQDGKLGEWIAQTFTGATIIASGFLDVLTKIVATQSQIENREIKAGKEEGKELLEADFDENVAGKSKEEQIAYLNKAIEQGIKNVKEYGQELNEVNKKIAESYTPWFEVDLKKRAAGLSKQLGIESGYVTAAKDRIAELNAVQVKATKETSKADLKAEEDRLKLLAELRKKELLLQLALIDEKLNNEDNYFYDRLKSLDDDFEKRKEIAQADFDEEMRQAGKNATKQRIAKINNLMELLKITEDYYKKQSDLEKLELSPVSALTKQKGENPLDALAKSAEKAEKAMIKDAEAAEKLRLKMVEIDAETGNWLKSFSTDFLNDSGFGSLNSFFDGTFKKMWDNADNTKEIFAIAFNSIAESAQEAFNFIGGLSQANFENEYARLEKQSEISLKYAGDNEAAQKKIEEDTEKRRKDIAYREAKAKRKQAIFNIAIDTAQAIIGLWANPGFPAAIPMAVIVGALGAAQIAVVASQEIPQYFDGGLHSQGGLAMINDGKGPNYVETVRTPDGKTTQYQGRNLVMDLPKGTEILTHDQWQKEQLAPMLKNKGINMAVNYNQNSGISKEDLYDVMQDTLGNQRSQNVIFDENGVAIFVGKRNDIARRNVNRGNGRGIKF